MADSDHVQLVESVIDLLKNINPWVTVGITCALIIWAITRARSAYFLLNRVWRLIGGSPVKDPEMALEWDTVRDLEGFRFITGINFESKKKLQTTLRWLEDNEKSLKDLSFARAWIDDQPWKVRAPNLRGIKAWTWIVLALTCSVIVPMSYLFGNQSALLTIKSSGVQFWTDGDTAKDFFFETQTPGFSITRRDCDKIEEIKLAPEDRSSICKTLDPIYQDYIKRSLVGQRAWSAYFGVLAFLVMTLTIRYLARARMAMKFSEIVGPENATTATT